MPNTEKENPAKLRTSMYAPVAGFSFSYYPSRLSRFLQRPERALSIENLRTKLCMFMYVAVLPFLFLITSLILRNFCKHRV